VVHKLSLELGGRHRLTTPAASSSTALGWPRDPYGSHHEIHVQPRSSVLPDCQRQSHARLFSLKRSLSHSGLVLRVFERSTTRLNWSRDQAIPQPEYADYGFGIDNCSDLDLL
jgi:hypothetical protein